MSLLQKIEVQIPIKNLDIEKSSQSSQTNCNVLQALGLKETEPGSQLK